MEEITLTKDELVYIFAEWARQYVEKSDQFSRVYDGGYADASANHFLRLLEQRRVEVADAE